MSGGSFDYLCYKDVDEILASIEQVENMAKALRELGNEDAAVKTESLLFRINAFVKHTNEALDDLHWEWRTVEWYYSGDIGKPDWSKE